MAYQTRSPVTPVLIAHAIGITTSTFLLGQSPPHVEHAAKTLEPPL